MRKTAIVLMDHLQRYVDKYQRCSKEFLFTDIPKFFPHEGYLLEGDSAQFVTPGFHDFQFKVYAPGSASSGDGVQRLIIVHGRNDYFGFSLQANGNRNNWFSTTNDSPLTRSAPGAKKLVRLLDADFGVDAFDRIVPKKYR